MANINVKNDDRRKEEEHVMRSYGVESTRSVHEGSGGDRSGPYQRSSKHGSEQKEVFMMKVTHLPEDGTILSPMRSWGRLSASMMEI